MSNTLTVTGAVTHNQGTLNTNGQTCTWGTYANTLTNTRTLTMGASAIGVSGASWTLTSATGMTITSNTATLTMSGASANFSSATINWNGLNVIQSGSGNATIAGVSPTLGSYTRNGTAAKTDLCILSATSLTCTNGFTLAGASVTNRVLMQTSAAGTQRTITAASATLSNVDFTDIAGAGTATWSGTSIGNSLGNSGISFDSPATQTWNANTTGTASTAANWTSRVPLPQDNIAINGLTSGTVTLDMPRIGANIDFTGSTGGTFTLGVNATFYGNLKVVTGLTSAQSNTLTAAGRGSQTITTNGVNLTNLTINAPTGTYSLQDDLHCLAAGTRGFALTSGTFVDNGHTMTWAIFTLNGAATRAITKTGTWSAIGTGTVWNATNTGITYTDSGTISITDTSVTAKTFIGGGQSYGSLSISGGGAGTVTFNGANTFANLPQITGGTKSIVWPGSATTTFTNGGNFGNSSNVITMTASAGSATLAFGTQVNANFLNLTNIIAATSTPAYAGASSTDGGGNTNWLFTSAPGANTGGTMMLLGVG